MAGSLEGVLAGIPGLGGYLASRQQREQGQMQELQQVSALSQLAAQMQGREKAAAAEQQERQMRSELAALGPNPSPEMLAGVAAKYAPAQSILTSQTASLDRRSALDAARVNAEAAREQRNAELEQRREQRLQEIAAQGQQAIDRVREQAAQNRITREEADRREATMREQMARLAAGLRAPPQPQPLVQIMGANGQPAWAERKDAVGRTPAGAGSKAEAAIAGKSDVDKDVMTLKSTIDELKAGGGMTDPSQGAPSNIAARIGASGIGQTVGGFVGTKNQTMRDKMNMIRPSLLRSIMQSTGMSAKQMDSNTELKLWLSTATDPTVSYEANMDALNNIAEKYGSGGFLDGSRTSSGKIQQPTATDRRAEPRAAGKRVVVDF